MRHTARIVSILVVVGLLFGAVASWATTVAQEATPTADAAVDGAVAPNPPVAVDDAATTPAGTPVAVAVLANDADPDGDALAVAEVGQPANGRAELLGDGTVLYTPNADFAGEDAFEYAASDGTGTAAARVVVLVLAPTPEPTATATPEPTSTPSPPPSPTETPVPVEAAAVASPTATATAAPRGGPVPAAVAAASLAPASGKVGTTVVLSVTGFTPNASISVHWYTGIVAGPPVNGGNADARGTAQIRLRVPALAAGAHRVEARGWRDTASATYTIVPSVQLSPALGPAGTRVTAALRGFAPREALEVRWYDGSGSRVLARATASSTTGSATAYFTVPRGVAAGRHKVEAIRAGGSRGATVFTVGAAPPPTATPTKTATPTRTPTATATSTMTPTATATPAPIAITSITIAEDDRVQFGNNDYADVEICVDRRPTHGFILIELVSTNPAVARNARVAFNANEPGLCESVQFFPAFRSVGGQEGTAALEAALNGVTYRSPLVTFYHMEPYSLNIEPSSWGEPGELTLTLYHAMSVDVCVPLRWWDEGTQSWVTRAGIPECFAISAGANSSVVSIPFPLPGIGTHRFSVRAFSPTTLDPYFFSEDNEYRVSAP